MKKYVKASKGLYIEVDKIIDELYGVEADIDRIINKIGDDEGHEGLKLNLMGAKDKVDRAAFDLYGGWDEE